MKGQELKGLLSFWSKRMIRTYEKASRKTCGGGAKMAEE